MFAEPVTWTEVGVFAFLLAFAALLIQLWAKRKPAAWSNLVASLLICVALHLESATLRWCAVAAIGLSLMWTLFVLERRRQRADARRKAVKRAFE